MTRYARSRPYALPESLADLTGPTHGTVELPVRLGWTGRRRYDLDDPADRAVLYERLITEASSPTDLALVSGPALLALWDSLFLPIPVRSSWTRRFPELAGAA